MLWLRTLLSFSPKRLEIEVIESTGCAKLWAIIRAIIYADISDIPKIKNILLIKLFMEAYISDISCLVTNPQFILDIWV